MGARDFLRSVTLGAPPRQFRTKRVVIRDASKPKVKEVDRDEEGNVVLEQALDEKKRKVFDDDGAPVMREKTRYRHPPTLDETGKPAEVEVREPGLKLRAAIYRAAGMANVDEERKIDMAMLQVESIIALTYEPGTNIKIFTEADRAALMSQPAGGFADDIFEVIQPLLNTSKEDEVEKN